MRRVLVILLLLTACKAKENAVTATAPKPSVPEVKAAPRPAEGSYAAGIDWFRKVRAFKFTLEEGNLHATGEMERPGAGAERVLVRANDGEWLGVVKVTGLVWYHREGPGWTPDRKPPEFADRVYQRATVAVDPQKKEGDAQLAGTEADLNHYKFTNAITGDAHEVWVSRRDNHIAKIAIDSRYTPLAMTITPDESVNVPQP